MNTDITLLEKTTLKKQTMSTIDVKAKQSDRLKRLRDLHIKRVNITKYLSQTYTHSNRKFSIIHEQWYYKHFANSFKTKSKSNKIIIENVCVKPTQ